MLILANTSNKLSTVFDIYNMKYADEEFINVCENSQSMHAASSKLGIHFNTFKRRAIKLGVYKPNQAGKGITKSGNGNKIDLTEIIEGKHPQYQTGKLRIRLIEEGLKQHKCELCGIDEWMGSNISLELDHVNGIRTDHRLENLRILCPNCHSQTPTYRAKNIKK